MINIETTIEKISIMSFDFEQTNRNLIEANMKPIKVSKTNQNMLVGQPCVLEKVCDIFKQKLPQEANPRFSLNNIFLSETFYFSYDKNENIITIYEYKIQSNTK